MRVITICEDGREIIVTYVSTSGLQKQSNKAGEVTKQYKCGLSRNVLIWKTIALEPMAIIACSPGKIPHSSAITSNAHLLREEAKGLDI